MYVISCRVPFSLLLDPASGYGLTMTSTTIEIVAATLESRIDVISDSMWRVVDVACTHQVQKTPTDHYLDPDFDGLFQ